jgi:6-phosphogluconolactonase
MSLGHFVNYSTTFGLAAFAMIAAACGGAESIPTIDSAVVVIDAPVILPDAPDPGSSYLLVAASDGKIYVALFDQSQPQAPLGTLNPYDAGAVTSFLALSPDGKHLFGTGESTNTLLSFDIARNTGVVTANNSVATGAGPTHVSVDKTGRWLFSANYTAGSITRATIGNDGTLSEPVTTAVGRNAHFIATDPSNQFAYAPCLGDNYVAQFSFNSVTGALAPLPTATVASESGAGPRHLALRPDGAFAYVINEINSAVTTYGRNTTTGELTRISSQSSLPSGFGGNNTGAEIVVTPNGKFVYVSNRGHNSVAGFLIEPNTGALSLISHTKVGQNPRSINVDPTGNFLVSGNLNDSSLSLFRITSTGTLVAVGGTVPVPAQPTFVGIFAVK